MQMKQNLIEDLSVQIQTLQEKIKKSDTMVRSYFRNCFKFIDFYKDLGQKV